jgi:predicted TPR repeat methyltransferase
MNRKQRRALEKRKDPQALIEIADLYETSGRLDQAEKKHREAIALDPHCYVAHNNLGDILRRTGRLAEAVKHFHLAFQIDPSEAVIAQNLAAALAQLNRFSEAIPFQRQVVALNPFNADAQTALAFSLSQVSNYGEAELYYTEALKLDPRHFVARINLGLALVDQGKTVHALEQAQILAHAENEAGFPHGAFGILLARAGRPDGAKVCFERYLAGHPGEADAIAMLLGAVGGALPSRATHQQITQLYTLQAERWGQVAEAAGGYQGHRLVGDALTQLNVLPADTILDVGCGTGLVGELLRPQVRQLIGIDLSEPMLAQAREKNVYDGLHRGDLLEYLISHPQSCDIVVSAATLIHFGELNAVLEAVARCLRPRGLFVFTVFPNDDDPSAVAVGTLNGQAQNCCFRHGATYIARTAAAYGFTVQVSRREVHEYARKKAIPGLIVALQLST